MKSKIFFTGAFLFWGFLLVCLDPIPSGVSAEEPKPDAGGNDQLMNRIDFGNSYIMGQSIKSGAVYLMHRKKSDISSMLKSRENYRDEILENLKVIDLESDTKKTNK